MTVRILHILAKVTGLFEHYTRITNNTPFLECVVKILNEINAKKPIRFDQPKEEVLSFESNLNASNLYHVFLKSFVLYLSVFNLVFFLAGYTRRLFRD